MAMTFVGFDWDDGNSAKCAKHGVSRAEIEEVLRGTPAVFPDLRHSQQEERWQAIGTTSSGRYVFVALTFRQSLDGRRVRPVSARYMHAKEIANYERRP